MSEDLPPWLHKAASVVVSQLPREIATRELAVLAERLGLGPEQCAERHTTEGMSPGNVALVEIRSEPVTEIVSATGEHGVVAKAVGRRAADAALEYIAAGRPVGRHLLDQLMMPLALLASGEHARMPLTADAATNLEMLRAFGVEATAIGEESLVRVPAIGG